jgi:hypothetical protein
LATTCSIRNRLPGQSPSIDPPGDASSPRPAAVYCPLWRQPLAAELGQVHDAPGDHQIDGEARLHAVGIAEAAILDAPAAFEGAMKDLDIPSQILLYMGSCWLMQCAFSLAARRESGPFAVVTPARMRVSRDPE